MSRAWYLGASPQQVGPSAILVGDPGRVPRFARRMEDVEEVNRDRGLVTVTGTFAGERITVSGFGMGAPIAAIVMHELSTIGVRRFLRLGTAMVLPPARIGELLIADAAVRSESTSATYVPDGYPAAADFELSAALREALQVGSTPWRAGVLATFDGFYTEMFAIEEERRSLIAERIELLRQAQVIGIDMETSALLAVGRSLNVQVASMCAATVDWQTQAAMEKAAREELEDQLVETGLRALTRPRLQNPVLITALESTSDRT